MFGGIIGYLVMALRDTGDLGKLRSQTLGTWTARAVHGLVIVKNLLSAALVSAVVTVVLSRISDTQFPIKVSVADFWGALTVGFIAYFTGNNLIDRIVGLSNKGGAEANPPSSSTDPSKVPPEPEANPPNTLEFPSSGSIIDGYSQIGKRQRCRAKQTKYRRKIEVTRRTNLI